ncbi:MAG: transporter substrate-binding domain-containing protein [Pseudomonadota bacterium]
MTRMILPCVTAVFLCASSVWAFSVSVASGEYAPFTGEGIADHGTVSARLSAYAESADISVDYAFMPWKRALEMTRRGQFDATSFWYFNEAREDDFIHVGPLVADRVVFFRRSDAELDSWTNLEDLSGLRIGIVSGYTYTPEFWALVDSGVLTVSEGPNDTANIQKLNAGRVDLVPVGEEAGWHMVRTTFGEAGMANFATEEQPLSVTFGYLLVSRAVDNAEEIATRLQAAIDADPFVTSARAQ